MTINPQRTTKLHGKRVWNNPWCECLDLRLAMMVGNIEPKLHTVCEITCFEQISKSLGEYQILIQMMFIQHIDNTFLFGIFYLSNRFN